MILSPRYAEATYRAACERRDAHARALRAFRSEIVARSTTLGLDAWDDVNAALYSIQGNEGEALSIAADLARAEWRASLDLA